MNNHVMTNQPWKKDCNNFNLFKIILLMSFFYQYIQWFLEWLLINTKLAPSSATSLMDEGNIFTNASWICDHLYLQSAKCQVVTGYIFIIQISSLCT